MKEVALGLCALGLIALLVVGFVALILYAIGSVEEHSVAREKREDEAES